MKRILVLTVQPISKVISRRCYHNTNFLHTGICNKDSLKYILGISHHIYENVYDTVIIERELFKYMTPNMEEIGFLCKPSKYVIV